MRNLFRPRRPGAAPTTTAPRQAAPRTAGGGGGTAPVGGGRRSRFEGMSLARFIQVLPEVTAEIAGSRSSIEARAAAAAEDQPVAQAVAAELYSIAAQMRRLEERAGTLQSIANRHHEPDRARWEAPRRGSHGVEQRADNQAARRDT